MTPTKPPLLCVFCGAETVAKEPCPKCGRPNVPGDWTEVPRGANARAVAVATLVLLLGPWCIPVVWTVGGISLLLHVAGVDLSIVKVSGDEMPRGGMIALGLLMPALAVIVVLVLRDLTAKVIGDLLDTDWHFRPTHPAITMLATTRGPKLRTARGSATFCEGEPALGADVTAGDVASAGAAEVARILGRDERDVLFAAALAGMIGRGEIAVRRSRTSRWDLGGAPAEHTGWDVRVVRAPEKAGATEAKLAAAVEQVRDASAEATIAPGYRETAATPLALGSSPLLDVHRHAYGTTEDAPRREGASAEEVAKRLGDWAKSEPELERKIVEMGEGQRPD